MVVRRFEVNRFIVHLLQLLRKLAERTGTSLRLVPWAC